MKSGVKSAAVMLIDALQAFIFTAAVLITAGCVYINTEEKCSGEMAFLMGYRLCYIESGSMEPAVRAGTLMLIEEASFEDIDVGDIITFETDSGYVTHRYMGIDSEAFKKGEEAYLITKGDANSIEDIKRLDPARIKGRAAFIM